MAALRWASCVQRLPEPLGVPRRPVVAARPAVQQLPGSRLAASSQQFPIVAQAQRDAAAEAKAAKSEAVRERAAARKRQQSAYQFAAIAASTLVTATAGFATYYRIVWHMANNDAFPYIELGATLALCAGAAFGMEMYARWVHKDMWHDNPVGYILHKSHHEPRTGPFEANDIYALANALPAMALCLYGFLRPDMWGALCFGAGLGITLFGISYMFVHDGLVHKRFPVGPIAELPAMKRIVLAHQLHHTEKYGGVPFGMFLGPQELEAVGAGPELDRLVAEAEAAQAARKKAAAADRRS
ncbi:beta-carotene hydroxylase [Micractinium conductrix]|uniref:beta-carotene 3-hydroxylase n=1 Tax=Micractinium conductrix TaxID=554055 RepID=A0A2P6V5N0_9CHLO|nr:beta-carotene hydroxylase [Micractinium conductrix]|eukprot:PSC69401.1 beta-carotene hydroxylase [Micractinium conductrix]